MSGDFGSFRFGWDGVNRISGATLMFQEATEVLPAEIRHDPIPFLPNLVNGDGTGTSSDTQLSVDGHPIWQNTPSPVDLIFWQGDDVVIPLYFNDPAIRHDDMAASFEWFAQVRRWHSYKSTLIDTFSVKATYNAAETEEGEYTMVELFLPRSDNTEWGVYQWELYSISTEDYSRFPKPDGVDAADWPPPDGLRTWLWGQCTIVPRTATTDVLPAPATTPGTPVLTQGGVFFSGPNGRVP